MKTFTFILCMAILPLFTMAQTKSFHDFTVKAMDGTDFNLSSLKGKKVLVVNTASKCGLTPQYEKLQLLFEKYGGDKFTIIAFPANNFNGQEPGTNEEIMEFCTLNYNVTFPVMSKISVKGDDMDALYKWLTQKSENGVVDAPITWNFQKVLVGKDGKVMESFAPKTLVTDSKVTASIESALRK